VPFKRDQCKQSQQHLGRHCRASDLRPINQALMAGKITSEAAADFRPAAIFVACTGTPSAVLVWLKNEDAHSSLSRVPADGRDYQFTASAGSCSSVVRQVERLLSWIAADTSRPVEAVRLATLAARKPSFALAIDSSGPPRWPADTQTPQSSPRNMGSTCGVAQLNITVRPPRHESAYPHAAARRALS
jgi:hypothetical protein